ncbi:MAG: hypothetical protein Q9168_000789 [Polycauliona sp. 1 TL-2023]
MSNTLLLLNPRNFRRNDLCSIMGNFPSAPRYRPQAAYTLRAGTEEEMLGLARSLRLEAETNTRLMEQRYQRREQRYAAGGRPRRHADSAMQGDGLAYKPEQAVTDLRVTIACATRGTFQHLSLEGTNIRLLAMLAIPIFEVAQATVTSHREHSIQSTKHRGRTLGRTIMTRKVLLLEIWLNPILIWIDQDQWLLNKAGHGATLVSLLRGSQDRSELQKMGAWIELST